MAVIRPTAGNAHADIRNDPRDKVITCDVIDPPSRRAQSVPTPTNGAPP
jgi:hypothetical protein